MTNQLTVTGDQSGWRNEKQWVVLRYRATGKSRCVADYGDYAWNSPLYDVVGYYPTHARAVSAAILAEKAR